MLKVPWVGREILETEAKIVLSDYSRKIREIKKPPVPVENIIEAYLDCDWRSMISMREDSKGMFWDVFMSRMKQWWWIENWKIRRVDTISPVDTTVAQSLQK